MRIRIIDLDSADQGTTVLDTDVPVSVTGGPATTVSVELPAVAGRRPNASQATRLLIVLGRPGIPILRETSPEEDLDSLTWET